jgi:hypothetical protein
VGNLLLDYSSGKIYTQSYTNNLIALGRSVRRLVDFDIYLHGEVGISFLRFYFDAVSASYKIIDKISRLFLSDIGGYAQDNALLEDSYLGFNAPPTLRNTEAPTFTLRGLADVQQTSPLDNDVLTFVQLSSTYISQDFFLNRSPQYGQWRFRPEASRLTAFDDVANNTISAPDLPVIGVSKPNTSNRLADVRAFRIFNDPAPTLGGDLDANGYAFVNGTIPTLSYVSTLGQARLSINPIIADAAVIHIDGRHCQEVVINPVFTFTGMVMLSVHIDNFSGEVLIYQSRYASGSPLALSGPGHILTLICNRDIEVTTVTVLLKASNVNR